MLEVILVDDAGDDGTAEAALALAPRPLVIRTPSPLGFTGAANLGLAAARGDVVLLLNSDTEVAPGALAALAAAFAADPRLGAAGAALAYPDGRAQWSGGRAPTLPWLFGLGSGLPALLGRLPFYRRLRPPGAAPANVEWVTGAALAIRRAALAEAGFLDERFRFYAQDLDLCLRLAAAGWRLALLPDVKVMHHHGATIARAGEAAGAQHPELLWTDLLRWAEKHRGAAWATRARRALTAGATLRLAGRRLAAPFIPPARRQPFRQATAAYTRARQALSNDESREGGGVPFPP
jgi:GT2 family glycosyltransferase